MSTIHFLRNEDPPSDTKGSSTPTSFCSSSQLMTWLTHFVFLSDTLFCDSTDVSGWSNNPSEWNLPGFDDITYIPFENPETLYVAEQLYYCDSSYSAQEVRPTIPPPSSTIIATSYSRTTPRQEVTRVLCLKRGTNLFVCSHHDLLMMLILLPYFNLHFNKILNGMNQEKLFQTSKRKMQLSR